MGKIHDEIGDRLERFIGAQHLFFVASAPLAADGHVNLSPKGLDSLRILGPRRVAYVDLVGSGAETIAHLRENGRVTLLFCAFEGPPNLLRLYGRGRVVLPRDDDWAELEAQFPSYPSARSIVDVEVERIADSCGYGVPQYRFEGERTQLTEWADRKGPDAIVQYQRDNNRLSIDALPALDPPD